jgi:hypothetical protein
MGMIGGYEVSVDTAPACPRGVENMSALKQTMASATWAGADDRFIVV